MTATRVFLLGLGTRAWARDQMTHGHWPRPRPSAWAHKGPGWPGRSQAPHTAPLFAGPVRKSLWQRARTGGKGARLPPPLPLPLRPVPGSRQTGRETEEAGGGQRESSRPACRPARWPLSKASGLEVPCTSPPCRPPPRPRLALSPGPSHSREATLKGDCAVSRRRPSRVAAQPHQTPRHPSLTSLYCPHPTNSCLIFGLSSGYPKTPADVPQ